MSGSSSQRSKTIRPAPPPPTRWRVWYLAEHPAALIGGFLLCLGVWGVVRWVTGQGYLALMALAGVVLSGWRFFVPMTYQLNAEGVEQAVLGLRWKIPWKAIGRYEITDSGVWLFPTPKRRPMDILRGVYLPWGQHRDEVVTHLRYYLDAWSV